MNDREREACIERYARGPALVRAAWEKVPAEARQWRPGPKQWSAHEVVCHCADSETMASIRIRLLVSEERPTIFAYDQDRWAEAQDYHVLPVDTALAALESTRVHTVALLRSLPAEVWVREGTHTESGRYTAEGWLRIYAEHLEKHAGQIERTLAAWRASV
jgi:hypothetical protein